MICSGGIAGSFNEDKDEVVDDFDIRTMANLIGKPLIDGRFKYQINA